MILESYLIKNKKWLTRRYFANRIGIGTEFLSMVIKGYSMPSLIIGIRIVQYTNGEVSYDDILKPFIDHVRAKNLIPDMYTDEMVKNDHESMVNDNHRANKPAPKLKSRD